MLNGASFRSNAYVCQICRQVLRRKRVGQRQFSSNASAALVEDDGSADIDAALRNLRSSSGKAGRLNEAGIQQISQRLHTQLFPTSRTTPSEHLTKLSRRHLLQHNLLGKNEIGKEEIQLDLPDLQGHTLDEHFTRLGYDAAEPYLSMAREYAQRSLPSKPESWQHLPGWTRYNANGTVSPVEFPDGDCLTFDTEVMYKNSPYAVMACAASSDAWFVWISPWLLGFSQSEKQLIPLGNDKNKLIIGHNVGYDRSRVQEEYDFKRSNLRFLDTLSLHQAANGMCSRQRPAWMKHKKKTELRTKILAERPADLADVLEALEEDVSDDLWISKSSTNSLREVAAFHCDATVDKETRKFFDGVNPATIVANLDQLLEYCAEDVRLTHLVYCKVLPNYLDLAPHPVSFAGLLHMNTMLLPVNQSWPKYLERSETTYRELLEQVQSKLLFLAKQNLEFKDKPEIYLNDSWLKQLDWSMRPVRMVKNKKTGEERLAKNQKMPGMPQWYRDLFPTSNGDINLTVRTRISPLLLKMNWEGEPLVWSEKYGWVIRAGTQAATENFRAKKYLELDMDKEPILALKNDVDAVFFKVPHKDGPTARVASPLAKSFVAYFESGVLSSEFPLAKEALKMNAMCSYWISSRDRITSQMVIWQDQIKPRRHIKAARLEGVGVILPQTIAMGTITRRATEPTWMTASNAKGSRVGSELKSMVQAPPGYCFVGADVDSEELWIASLMGDAQFQAHGATALGWMTLEGSKSSGTDLHSKTAEILGISRDNAKIFNYGRIYGAGLKFAVQLLQQFNPTLSEVQARETAERLYEATKGIKGKVKTVGKKGFWRGGTESYVFNRLETMAEQDKPRTPVLGCGITEALLGKNLSPGGFLTSRINWAIQSSGVDYLHLLIASMEYLIKLYKLDARLSITVHDEIRYLVADADKYTAALALQVSNLWTRAMFSEQLGIYDLPQSCAFFSEVDIDHVLRKNPSSPCITPSNPDPISPGQSIDIAELLALLKYDSGLSGIPKPDLSEWRYVPRARVFDDLNENDLKYLEAQNMKDVKEVEALYASKNKSRAASNV